MINTRTQPVAKPALNWRENVQTFRMAAWLGWQVEGNWADPLAFIIFTVLRPMAAALIIVVMYQVIAGGQRDSFFTYLYLSNAFFVLVIQVISGMAWTIIDDREQYKMLKYIYTSPARTFAYLIGRAMAKLLIGLVTALILLPTGFLFLGLSLQPERIEWGWLALYFPLGMIILGGLGIGLAGIALVIARHGGSIGETVAGLLLLFSSAYFPPDILPPVLREMSLLLPVTYWLEALRRALTGGVLQATIPGPNGTVTTAPISPLLAQYDNVQLLLILVVSAVVCAVGSILFYRWVERQAKERGMIDRVTGY
jgi:ABC-2 type transport system permease protein